MDESYSANLLYKLSTIHPLPLFFILFPLLMDVMAGTGATIWDLEMTMTLGMEVKHSREIRQKESPGP